MTGSVCVSMPTLRKGSRGDDVRTLQAELNRNLRPSPNLDEDGIFGTLTRDAVRKYQRQEWLVIDGIVGDCTWSALLGLDTYNYLHHVRLIPQQDNSACWLAATSMILGRTSQIPRSSVPSSLLASDGGLLNDSELNDPVHVRAYSKHFNLQMYYPQSWTASGLASIIRHGPVATHILWNVTGYVNGSGSSGHFAVIAGIRGNGTATGTTLRIYDPWPPRVGKIASFGYAKLMRHTPALTYNLFQR